MFFASKRTRRPSGTRNPRRIELKHEPFRIEPGEEERGMVRQAFGRVRARETNSGYPEHFQYKQVAKFGEP